MVKSLLVKDKLLFKVKLFQGFEIQRAHPVGMEKYRRNRPFFFQNFGQKMKRKPVIDFISQRGAMKNDFLNPAS